MKTYLAVLFLCVTSVLWAQDRPIKNLVFEGAGIRGIAYAGVLEVLEKEGKIAGVEKVGGTSAGAITALMVALGYKSGEVEEIVSATKFEKFNDGEYFFVGGFARMKKKFGWYKGDQFTRWLEALIVTKTGDANITFAELNEGGYKDLYITATCLNKQKLIVFSKENYPNMKVKDAVRISMSIPLYFEAVFIDKDGNLYDELDDAPHLDIVVDGGITGNFPIFIFDEVIEKEGQLIRIANPATVGFRIDSDEQIKYDQDNKELAPIEIESLNDYMEAFYVMVLENLNRHMLTDDDWARTVSISSKDIAPKIKKLSKEQKLSLVESGKLSTQVYLNNW